jgi:hypothetical protein
MRHHAITPAPSLQTRTLVCCRQPPTHPLSAHQPHNALHLHLPHPGNPTRPQTPLPTFPPPPPPPSVLFLFFSPPMQKREYELHPRIDKLTCWVDEERIVPGSTAARSLKGLLGDDSLVSGGERGGGEGRMERKGLRGRDGGD